VYWWREHDEDFVLRENQAQQVLTDALEEESIRSGLEGYQRPIYQRGELVGYETVYGDQLLNLHLGGPGTANGRRNFMSVIASSPPSTRCNSSREAVVVAQSSPGVPPAASTSSRPAQRLASLRRLNAQCHRQD